MRTSILGSVVLTAFGQLAGCGGGDAGTPPASVSDSGTAETATASESVTILVRRNVPPFTEPAAGISLVFDKPGGERVETKSGADGLATITGVDWSKGTAALTVLNEGNLATTWVALDKTAMAVTNAKARVTPGEPKRDMTAYSSPAPTRLPSLAGALEHAQGAEAVISPTSEGSPYYGGASTYALSVKGGAPFSLITLERSPILPTPVSARGFALTLHRWGKIDRPALAGDEMFDIDFDTASPLTPSKAKGKLLLPGGKAGPFGANSTFSTSITSTESGGMAVLGAASRADVSADGSAFEFELEYLKLDGVTPRFTYTVQTADVSSTARTAGLPGEVIMVDQMLTPPLLAGASTRSLTEPFAFENVPADSILQVNFSTSTKYTWAVEVPIGVTSFTLPPLEGALAKAVGSPTTCGFAVYSKRDPVLAFYAASATGKSFRLAKTP